MSKLGIQEIMTYLPHRYPILLVDKIEECDEEKKQIVGLKNVTANEPFFQGHFPGRPVMPGVLQLEAMAQTGGVLLKRAVKGLEGTPYFMSIDKAKFRQVVRPGDQLRIEVNIVSIKRSAAKFHGRILVDGTVVCEAEMLCMMVKEGDAP